MNQQVKDRWVAALRSGDYQQGKGYLQKMDGSFCCLGVLCELAVQAGVIAKPDITDEGLETSFMYDGSLNMLPDSVSEWAQCHIDSPEVSYVGIQSTLWDLNDNAGLSFAELADIIQEQL